MLDVFQLKEKALRGDLQFCVTGDGADLCSSTNTASQSFFGLKIIDKDAINPVTSEPLLYLNYEDSNGEIKLFYHGAQSYETGIVAGAVMAKEKQAMQSHCFTSIMDFFKKVVTEGISANGGAVEIPPKKWPHWMRRLGISK